MSLALIAIVLVLMLSHARPEWSRLRDLQPLRALLARLDGGPAERLPAVLLQIVLPGALLFAFQLWLDDWWFGLPHVLYGTVMLYLCWGPRDLDADVQALREAVDGDARRAARTALGLDAELEDPVAAIGPVFRAALQRWFGPLLWFVLLGGAGALMFRLVRLASDRGVTSGSALASLRTVFDWPVAQLMALALAVVGNFDAVLQAWRSWHEQRGAGWFVADLGFLDAAARCSVVVEQREQREEQEDEAPSDAVVDAYVSAVSDTLSLLWRMLLGWLVVLALMVIAGVTG